LVRCGPRDHPSLSIGFSSPGWATSLGCLASTAGALGPSTIVGSAAYNLFVITSVCLLVLPAGETRRLDNMGVFLVTVVFSMFAYIWLIIILVGSSPDVVEVWEVHEPPQCAVGWGALAEPFTHRYPPPTPTPHPVTGRGYPLALRGPHHHFLLR
jgi:hypothetical protein